MREPVLSPHPIRPQLWLIMRCSDRSEAIPGSRFTDQETAISNCSHMNSGQDLYYVAPAYGDDNAE